MKWSRITVCGLMSAALMLQLATAHPVRLDIPGAHKCCCADMKTPADGKGCCEQQKCSCPAWINTPAACREPDAGLSPHRPLLSIIPDANEFAPQRTDKPEHPPPIGPAHHV